MNTPTSHRAVPPDADPRHPHLWSAVLAVALAGCAGCAGPGGAGGLLSQVDNAELTQTELDARVHELGWVFNLRSEQALRQTYVESTDHQVRQAAVVTIVRISEEATRASFHGDPLAILVDLWALARQCHNFFETGDGVELFPADARERIAAVFADVEEGARAIVHEVHGADTIPNVEPIVMAWADDNPIVGREFLRASTAPFLAALAPDRGRGLLETAQTLEQSMSDLTYRLETMQINLPKQILWNAAAYVDLKLGALEGDAVLERLDRMLVLLEELPAEVDRQRSETLDFVTGEREATLEAIRTDLMTILDALRDERIAVMSSIEQERIAILDRVDELQQAILQGIDGQRVDTHERLDGLAQVLLGDVDRQRTDTFDLIDRQRTDTLGEMDVILASTVDRTVDGVFWLLAKICLGAFVGLVVIVVLIRVLWRRPA